MIAGSRGLPGQQPLAPYNLVPTQGRAANSTQHPTPAAPGNLPAPQVGTSSATRTQRTPALPCPRARGRQARRDRRRSRYADKQRQRPPSAQGIREETGARHLHNPGRHGDLRLRGQTVGGPERRPRHPVAVHQPGNQPDGKGRCQGGATDPSQVRSGGTDHLRELRKTDAPRQHPGEQETCYACQSQCPTPRLHALRAEVLLVRTALRTVLPYENISSVLPLLNDPQRYDAAPEHSLTRRDVQELRENPKLLVLAADSTQETRDLLGGSRLTGFFRARPTPV